jgi:hypothetical protein
MGFSYRKGNIALITVLLIAFIIPATAAANIEKTYSIQSPSKLVSHQYGVINVQSELSSVLHPNQKLYVSILPSLINYYGNLTHAVNDDSDYAQFVTPQVVAPIAECLRKGVANLPYSNELFADAVLALVHQITYNVTSPKYPVETLVDNYGDCVGLSTLAASIMEAGGLNVVLILYTNINPQHMNVGVYLPYTPVYHTPLMSPTSFTYDNETYWTAECTPAGNWKVGDQSPSLAGASAIIIPFSKTTQSLPPAQVSASLNSNLLPSTITINPGQQAPSTDVNGERTLTISGSITPAIANQTVNIYISGNTNEPSNYYGYPTSGIEYLTTVTGNDSNYSLAWNFTSSGTYYITASWNGASNYAGADSQTLPVFVGPQSYYQFEAIDYNYIFGQPSMASLATAPMQGVNDFLTLPLGANVSLGYDFIVLQAGQTISNVPTTNVTMPASEEMILMSNGRVKIIQVPSYNETIPLSVPNGLAPLRLPDDFNETLDNQFCFILQNNSGNYSLSIKGLSDDDLSNIQANAAITNATAKIKEDTWYQITTNITDNAATTNLSSINGTLTETTKNSNSYNQTVLLITNNEDTAIVLKNLTIQTQNTVQKPQSTLKPTSKSGNLSLALYSIASILSAATIVAVLYIKKQKKSQKQTHSGSPNAIKQVRVLHEASPWMLKGTKLA